MQQTELESQVVKATVYTDRAMIIRSATTQLHPGSHNIALLGLPQTFHQDSLRISGNGDAAVTIIDFKLRQRTHSEVPEEEVRALMQQRKHLLHKQEALNGEQEVIRQQKAFLQSIGVATTENISKELSTQRPSVTEYKQVLDFMGKEARALDEEYRSISRELESVAEALTLVNARINGYNNLTSTVRHYAEVEIEVAEAGEFTFEVSYLTPNARWLPMYDARVNATEKTVNLRYFGQVNQHTGEDWKQVEVKLSTARPQLGGNPPTITPWYVREFVPQPQVMRSAAPAGRELNEMAAEEVPEMMAGAVAPPAPKRMKKPAALRQATVEQSEGASAVFSTQGKSDVPGDGSNGKLLILERAFPNQFRYLTVPKIAEHVYLTAEVENDSEFPLLPGKVNIFMDGNFVGNARLPQLVTPEETFELSLGVDESIRVTHKLLRKKGDEKGLFTKSKVQHFAYLITIENLRKTAENITVQDQLPVSQTEKIKVETQRVNPNENPDKDADKLPNGTLEWKLAVEAKSEAKIELEFTVSYPREMRVSGI